VRTGLDVTPLLGRPTGVGRYVGALARALVAARQPDDEWLGMAFTLRGRELLPSLLPEGMSLTGAPVPARALHLAWARTGFPTVGALGGRVDLFHATNFVLPPTGRAAGVVTVHDLSYLRTPETVSRASAGYVDLVPRSLSRAAVVCVPSEAVAAEVRETYPQAADRVLVTPLGVDPAWAAAPPADHALRLRLGLPADYLVVSGSLEPRKNLPFLLEVHRALRAEDPDWPALVLVGPDGWGPSLDLGRHPPGSVVLTGYLDDDDLRRVVAGSRALLFPTRYEGFGLPPLEAFACGTPVVASDLPVVREVVGPDADLRHLAPVGDHDAWASALLSVVRAGEVPGTADRRRARAGGFTWSGTAAATRQAYARALTGR
jgi:glycosyltransferase involved in cell wall biosynthesis